jgi:phosphoenolpyruvate-protein kinase (PTS system EI component)/YHS domain-containing protein
MIETTDDLFFVQDLLRQTIHSLEKEGITYKQDFQQGVMIEVPSTAWGCREILEHVDFASLGTNDLLQYFFAVDRNNANAYHSYRPENPAAIRMLKCLVETAGQLDKPLHICGEIASDKRLLPLLIGLGFKDISIDIHNIDDIEHFILGLDIPDCKELAEKCVASKTSRQVNAVLNDFMPRSAKASEKMATEDSDVVDPICGMVVHGDDSYILEHNGDRYYFCSLQCKNEFERILSDE